MTTEIVGDNKKLTVTRYQYTMDGRCIREIAQRGWLCGCLDTRRDYIVGSGTQSLLCMDREGGKIREIPVESSHQWICVVYNT